jgi:hypothetical protein
VRIPKPVNAVLDWAERQSGALGVVIALVAVALAALWLPALAGLILGLAVGGFAVHLRQSRRVSRLRREVDDLLRQNGALRHRNTVLNSGVITKEAQMTQALVAIPEELPEPADPQRTQMLPAIPGDPSETSPSGRTRALEEIGEIIELGDAEAADSGTVEREAGSSRSDSRR